MSRTHAHTPENVATDRERDRSIIVTRHRHWVANPLRRVECGDPAAGCYEDLPRWASTQPWSRRGTARIERDSVVRALLRTAAKQYRATGQVDVEGMPCPATFCLCQMCGMG